MKILYIGQYSKGTTSRMRALQIEHILKPVVFDVIDTNIPFYNINKVFRSIGFRLKKGPLISKLNVYIKDNFKTIDYDLIWVDKGIYIQLDIIKLLKTSAKTIVHYTPDMAFYGNRSKLFEKSLPYYDYSITTKTAILVICYYIPVVFKLPKLTVIMRFRSLFSSSYKRIVTCRCKL